MEKIATRGAYGEELVALAEQYPELAVSYTHLLYWFITMSTP